MNSVNGVDGIDSVNVIDSSTLSQQDFISAVYLERGNMLDAEVRRLVGEVEEANSLLNSVGSMISKADIAQYGPPDYSQTTWTTNNTNIVLDNGYHLSVKHSEAGNSFVLSDAEGNQLIYQNQTLIPTPKGATVDALKSGIPVMQDLTLVLDDGTEITFKAGPPDSAFDGDNFSGGLADITSIFITRGNQGVSVTNLNGNNIPLVSQPTVEGVTPVDIEPEEPVTETIIVPSGQANFHDFAEYSGSSDYSKIETDFREQLNGTWLPPLSNLSTSERDAILESLSSGLSIDFGLGESDGGDDRYYQTFTYTPRQSDTLETFIKRVIDDGCVDFKGYVENEESGVKIEGVWADMTLPTYSYQKPIPEGDKTTKTQERELFYISEDYHRTGDYGKLTGDHSELLKAELKEIAHGMSPDQLAGFKDKLQREGAEFHWRLQDRQGTDNYYQKEYIIKLIPGEEYDDFIDRAVQASAENFKYYIDFDQDEEGIQIDFINNDITFPAFDYDEYEVTETVEEAGPITYHSLDQNNNDGYVLLESGGLHNWLYDGKSVSTLNQQNPNDNDDNISGYFARKLAFNTAETYEHAGGIPTLTAEEIDILNNILKIKYSDASGVGHLTPEEWARLKPGLEAAKDNLTSSSQLQTVQLQRALTTFTQNYDAMSNAQSRIYSLLKDIINNVK